MHKALCIPDVIFMVANLLSEEESSPNPHRALLNFSLVCKAFCTPALDLLWRKVPIESLLQALPRSLLPLLLPAYDNDATDLPQSKKNATKDWDRFLKYSRRIRHLICSENNRNQALGSSFEAMERILLNCPVSPFLNLRTLEYKCLCWEHLGPIAHLNVRSLETMDIAIGFRSPNKKAIFDIPKETATQVRQLRIAGENLNENIVASLPSRFPALTLLALRFAPSLEGNNLLGLLQPLNALAHLQDLELELKVRDLIRIPRSTSCTQEFLPELRRLKLSGSCKALSTLLFGISSPHVMAIDVRCKDFGANDDLFRVIKDKFSSSLRTISVFATEPLAWPASTSHGIDTIAHLLEMHLLTSVTISIHPPLILHDRDLGKIADAWPQAHTLHFAHSVPRTTQISLTGLLAFVARSRRLESLGINAAFIRTSFHVHAIPGPLSNTLRFLDVGGSRIGSAQDVLLLLRKAFPQLKELEFSRAGTSEDESSWKNWEVVQRSLSKTK